MRELLGKAVFNLGLNVGTAGAGAAVLLVLSPKARKRARTMLVSAIASGIKLTQQAAGASSSLLQDIKQATSQLQQPAAQMGMMAAELGMKVAGPSLEITGQLGGLRPIPGQATGPSGMQSGSQMGMKSGTNTQTQQRGTSATGAEVQARQPKAGSDQADQKTPTV